MGVCQKGAFIAVVGGLFFGCLSYAKADNRGPLFLDNGQINPAYQQRCSALDLRDMTPQQCATAAPTAQAIGCINQRERELAEHYGVLVVCNPVPGRTHEIHDACPCSCFRGDTPILTMDKNGLPAEVRADAISKSDRPVSLGDNARLGSFWYQPRSVLYTTSGPEAADLYLLQATGHAPIAVTRFHAVLLADGRVVTAMDLQVGDSLVDHSGKPVRLESIERQPADGNVYNFLTSGEGKAAHLIVAGGLVVGDLLWQNALGAELGEVAVRQ